MNSKRWFQWFYYFRTAYGIYLNLIVSLPAYLIIIHSYVSNSFPNFRTFVAVFGITILAGGIFLGWWHIRHSQGYRSEVEAVTDMNPYNYKATPGKEQELNLPFFVLSINLTLRFYDRLTPGLLTSQERKTLEDLKAKAELLLAGGNLGSA